MTPEPTDLTMMFQALADPTRRAVVQRLGAGDLAVKELAGPFEMALPSFLQHIAVLEDSGLISTRKIGRVRSCSLNRQRFRLAETWLKQQYQIWEGRTDRLSELAETLVNKEQQT